MRAIIMAALAASLISTVSIAAAPQPIVERSIAELAADLSANRTTSQDLVKAYTARIKQIDQSGPTLRSVIAINPKALADAAVLDAERKAGKLRSALHGIPILVKDNIETSDPLPTTAGSLALANNLSHRDAPIIARLRAAGAIILGKTNLSEWANIRSTRSISGWSGIGGLVKNPNVLDRSACGSSSGTGAAIAASLGAVGIGTETDGSIVCPSSANGLVGFKPTVGMASRTHIVPISHSQDTPGPMGRSVADVALLLTYMAGTDSMDPATASAGLHVTDFTKQLPGASLKGKRLGILRHTRGRHVDTDALFDKAVAVLKAQGAEIVDVDSKIAPEMGRAEFAVLVTELKADLNTYLASTPMDVASRTLADVIAFNKATPRELVLFNQEIFEQAEATTGLEDPAYLKARETSLRMAGAEGIDKYLADQHLDALIAPTMPPAWRVDIVGGDHSGGGVSTMAAIAGYPHLTVPMGYSRGLPVGLSFIGTAWSDAEILALGAAYEKASHARRPPSYSPASEDMAEREGALAPITHR